MYSLKIRGIWIFPHFFSICSFPRKFSEDSNRNFPNVKKCGKIQKELPKLSKSAGKSNFLNAKSTGNSNWNSINVKKCEKFKSKSINALGVWSNLEIWVEKNKWLGN